MITDENLHKAMAEIGGHIFEGGGKDIELMPGWIKPLPYFGWFWRTFDWNRVPLGLQVADGEPTVVGIMAKNKWYYREYYCTPNESGIIRSWCEDIATGYSEQRVKCLTLYLQTLADNDGWSECDREAIDARTMENFLAGNYKIVDLSDLIKDKQ